MNWWGIIFLTICLATIPGTFLYVRFLDKRDDARAEQVNNWITEYDFNGPPEEA